MFNSSSSGTLPRLLLAAAALISLMGCGQPLHFEKKEYHGHFKSDRLNVCLQVPTAWEIREGLSGLVVMCRSPLEAKGDAFRENLVIQEIAGGAPDPSKAEEWMGTAVTAMSKELDGFKEYERGKTPTPFVIYTHKEAGGELKSKSFFVSASTTGLELTYTSTPEAFASWLPRFDEIEASLKLDQKLCDHPGAKMGPSGTPTPGASGTPAAAVPTETPAIVATPSATPAASATPVASPTPVATVTVTATPAATPTGSATP